ncbi:MAG TPA: hypothetical protein VFF73_08035, partial [Planctomycetota bacterium]|nr:hypothetical protein [Planctomycetota bacterium]
MDHADRVDRWLGQAAKGLSGERRVILFERAVEALWRRAHVTLGEVTLGAVTERVLYFATEKFPFLSPLRVSPAVGFLRTPDWTWLSDPTPTLKALEEGVHVQEGEAVRERCARERAL